MSNKLEYLAAFNAKKEELNIIRKQISLLKDQRRSCKEKKRSVAFLYSSGCIA